MANDTFSGASSEHERRVEGIVCGYRGVVVIVDNKCLCSDPKGKHHIPHDVYAFLKLQKCWSIQLDNSIGGRTNLPFVVRALLHIHRKRPLQPVVEDSTEVPRSVRIQYNPVQTVEAIIFVWMVKSNACVDRSSELKFRSWCERWSGHDDRRRCAYKSNEDGLIIWCMTVNEWALHGELHCLYVRRYFYIRLSASVQLLERMMAPDLPACA